MTDTDQLQRHLTVVEDTLVSEFRGYQNLVALTQNERQALLSNNAKALQEVLAQKEALLGDMERMENTRLAAQANWAHAAGCEVQTLADMLPQLETATAERLKRLRDGILALTTQLRELAQGNRALANSALEGVEAIHNFLLSLSQVPVGYQRPGTPQSASPSVALAVEQLI